MIAPPSSIRLPTIEDAENLDLVSMIVKPDTVIAEAQTQLSRLDIGEAFDITVAGENVI
jgi:hypothetical protein